MFPSRFLLLSLFISAAAEVKSYAFPPAPGVIVHGTVRDTFGWSLEGDDAFIVFRSGESVIVRSGLNPDLTFGENYRTLLAVDMDKAKGVYRSGTVDADLPFIVTVEIGNQVYYPIETFIGIDTPTVSASVIRMDFNLGVDFDGDGIPDEWEYSQLSASGLPWNDPRFNLEQFSHDGDFDGDGLSDYNEYLAGTYAYLGSDHLKLELIGPSADGWFEFEFLAISGKAYQIQSSSELDFWLPEPAGLDGDRLGLQSTFRATNTRIIRVSVPPGAATLLNRQFRVAVN